MESTEGLHNLPWLSYLGSGRMGFELGPSGSRVVLFTAMLCCFCYHDMLRYSQLFSHSPSMFTLYIPPNYTALNSTKCILFSLWFTLADFFFSQMPFDFTWSGWCVQGKKVKTFHGSPDLHQEASRGLAPPGASPILTRAVASWQRHAVGNGGPPSHFSRWQTPQAGVTHTRGWWLEDTHIKFHPSPIWFNAGLPKQLAWSLSFHLN